MKVHHIGVSLINNDVRKAGSAYRVVTNLRSHRIKFLDEEGKTYSSEKKNGWKFVKAK